MRREIFLSLKVKLGLLVAAIVLAIMGIMTYTSVIRQESAMKYEMRSKAINMAQITGALALLGGNAADPWAFAKQFLKFAPQLDDNILYIVILGQTGSIIDTEINMPLLSEITGKDDKAFVEGLPNVVRERIAGSGKGPEGQAFMSRLGHLLPIDVVLKPGDNFIGTMSIGYSLYRFDASVDRARLITLLFTLTFTIVGILASFGLSSNITKPIYRIVDAMKHIQQGDLEQHVTVKTRDEMQMLASNFNFMIDGLKEREHIKQTFKRYVSELVAEHLIKEREVSITGERKTATILFQDIRGFTSMSEQMSPEEVVSILKEYFTAMVDVIFAYEGTLDKYIGDAIMAVFGTPYAHEDDPSRAVKTAIDMQRALKALNQKWENEGKNRRLAVGCGIATGPVVAGSMGSEKRLEYTVIGDTVNLASRIEGLTKGGQILICDTTHTAVKDNVGIKPLDKVYVKGKKEPQQIYEVLYEL
ncbi:MAG: HAMP domain-containing protein [Deltaproteobacteria bacterium]|nr:HAMP domain-containing protein [Deltaproteobacteria bacterium]MCL5277551.1 HAMP domain-containing protein [Deltaproteobacteria bacterium]